MSDMKILSQEEITKRLADRKLLTIQQKTGISYSTLKKMRDGVKANHTLKTIERVSDYLTANDAPRLKS